MPELPEVETIKNELLPWIVGQSFTQVTLLDRKLLRWPSPEEFQQLVGQSVESLERRGKYLIFHLSSGLSLIMHLRMTGALLLNPESIDHCARAVFHLSNDARLAFSDRRRLGAIWLGGDAGAIIGKLGPEPLAEDFTPNVLSTLFNEHCIPIKAALIDQNIIAGIGNMYADEILFAARIHPLRRTDTLSDEEIQSLYNSIRVVLASAIGNKGASVDTYIRPGGQLGRAQFDFKVAHRKGQTCPVCHAPIQRILVRNRGTYFCPNCQHATTWMPLLSH